MQRVLLGLSAWALAASAYAQEPAYPTRPIRMVVPWSAGSQTDLLARMVGPKLAESLGQPVVMDNRAGAGGTLGAALVAIAPPDGHTIMMQAAAHAVSPAIYPKLPYDTIRDFSAISRVASVPNVLVVAPSLGIRSVKDLIALAKQKPGQINFASAGVGGGTHTNGEQFKTAAAINVVHVPHKGTPEALVEVAAGRIHYFFAPLGSAQPFLKEGRLVPLAVSTLERSPILPDLPTIAEAASLPGFDFDLWYGLFAPAKLPKPIVQKLSSEMKRILSAPDIRARLAVQGVVPRWSSPEDFEKFVRLEVERLGKIIRDSGAAAN
ncbi:MAG: tripartite tricarboxylate transporter substrate binding protein [Burkholderiales bacterium]|nr:tripartite tricarboxylate transporter substrate binding protein [Burkholderiales bacterium]